MNWIVIKTHKKKGSYISKILKLNGFPKELHYSAQMTVHGWWGGGIKQHGFRVVNHRTEVVVHENDLDRAKAIAHFLANKLKDDVFFYPTTHNGPYRVVTDKELDEVMETIPYPPPKSVEQTLREVNSD